MASRRVARVALVLFCGTCFLVQVHNQFLKFMGGEMTTVMKVKEDTDRRYPVVSVCAQHGEEVVLSEENLDVDDRAWNNSTSHVWEIVEVISAKMKPDMRPMRLRRGIVKDRNGTFVFKEFPSDTYGSCFSVENTLPSVGLGTYADLKLHIPEGVDSLTVFLTSAVPEAGLTTDVWISDYFSLQIERRQVVTLGVTKTVRRLDPGLSYCSEAIAEKDYETCVVDRAREHLSDVDDVCFVPETAHWTAGRRPCLDVEQHAGTVEAISDAVLHVLAEGTACPISCFRTQFEFSKRVRKTRWLTRRAARGDPSDASVLRMYYASSHRHVQFVRDRKLYDLNAILAAVGGSMGLFLGFSFLQFATKLLDTIHSRALDTNGP